MRKTRLHALSVLLCLGFVAGCGKPEPRFSGIVQSHADTYRSGTGGSCDLLKNERFGGGFHYADGKKTDWKSEIGWKLIAHRGNSDVYQFSWVFSPVGGVSITRNKEVEYDGKESVIVFQNDSEVVSIEPGSIKSSQDSKQNH